MRASPASGMAALLAPLSREGRSTPLRSSGRDLLEVLLAGAKYSFQRIGDGALRRRGRAAR